MSGIILSLIGVLGQKLGKTFNKLSFNKTKSHPAQEILITFSSMLIILFGFIAFFGSEFTFPSSILVIVLVSMVFISFLKNFWEFRGVKLKDLAYREPISNLQPLLTSFMAFFLFPTEREIKYIVGIFLAILVLYFVNNKKKSSHHFKLDKGTLFLIGSMICSAVLENIYKFGLRDLAPEYLYLVRVLGILILTVIFQYSHLFENKYEKKQLGFGFLAGLFYTCGFLAKLFAIKSVGLNFTILIYSAGPSLVYLISHLFLKEEVHFRQVLSSFLIILIVVVTLLI